MSDEYLWDKTGSDTDIERLETALVNYRFRETAAPRLPVLETVLASRRPFLFKLSVAFASAACLAMITVLAMWLGISRKAPLPTGEVSQNGQMNTATGGKKIEPANIGPNPTEPSVTTPVTVVASQRKSPTNKIRNTVAKRSIKRETVPLTKDEKYAYDQLRLALWIAGSKAKIVQDTIDRVDEHKSSATRNDK